MGKVLEGALLTSLFCHRHGWTMDGRWRRRVRRALSHVGLNYKEFRYEKRWISI